MDGEHKVFSPEEITSLFLTKMKETAENFLGKEIELALITFPGIPWSMYYTDVQHAAWNARRSAMKEAGCVSGLLIERWNCDPDAPQRAAIGIDLGSTYCRVGTWSYINGVEIIPNDRGNLVTPSWISFTHNQTFIGEDAKNRALDYPERRTQISREKI